MNINYEHPFINGQKISRFDQKMMEIFKLFFFGKVTFGPVSIMMKFDHVVKLI